MTTELHSRRPELLQLLADDKMPNSELPVIILRGVATDGDLEALFRQTFTRNGWVGLWTDGIFGYHHFHSNAHEVLGVIAGSANLVLGGESGEAVTVERGDVLVLPPGTGHRRIRATPDFLVVGAYPEGQERYDIYVDVAMCANCRNRLNAVPLPKADPIYGDDGPVLKSWRR